MSVFLTVGIPIINYIIFKTSITQGLASDNLEKKYDLLIMGIITVGILISICSYMYFKCPKFSVRRGAISLTHSILDLVFLILFSQFAIINIISKSDCASCSGYSISGISLNLSGVFAMLIILSSLFVIKNLYDLLDFKINENYYMTWRREQRKKLQKTN